MSTTFYNNKITKKALFWWNNLSKESQKNITLEFYDTRGSILTNIEIQQLWDFNQKESQTVIEASDTPEIKELWNNNDQFLNENLKDAIIWWHSLAPAYQSILCNKHLDTASIQILDIEIKKIWDFEINTKQFAESTIRSTIVLNKKTVKINYYLKQMDFNLKEYNKSGNIKAIQNVYYYKGKKDEVLDNLAKKKEKKIIVVLQWWNNLPGGLYRQQELSKKYYNDTVGMNATLLTDKEIKHIWKKETQI